MTDTMPTRESLDEAAMIEGARLALEWAKAHLREASGNAMANGYSEHAEGVGEAADLLEEADPAQIIKEAGDE